MNKTRSRFVELASKILVIISLVLYEAFSFTQYVFAFIQCEKCGPKPPTFDEVVHSNARWFFIDLGFSAFALVALVLAFVKLGIVTSKRRWPLFLLVLLFGLHFASGWAKYVYDRMRCHSDCHPVPYYPIFDAIVTATWAASLPLIAAALLFLAVALFKTDSSS